ncbi:MAG TPA: winged helix-turn-helix domain-containing protein [Actinomycetota bacterium]|nr:winged helix-turn-helix domain-containing protein [Actinomycetota bacterium]
MAGGKSQPTVLVGVVTNGLLPSGELTFVLSEATPAAIVDMGCASALGRVAIDAARRQVLVGDARLPVTRLEFELLRALTVENASAKTYEWLSSTVWRNEYLGDSAHIRAAAKRLRRKLEAADSGVEVECIRGVGFRLTEASMRARDGEAEKLSHVG